ncbi:MAG: SBBP repeat-containing protein [Thermodesulfobacteriota bacterium]
MKKKSTQRRYMMNILMISMFVLFQVSSFFISPAWTADGDHVWARALGGESYGEGFGIVADEAGHVYATGNFQGIADFNPGPETYELTSAGGEDIYVVKLDKNGDLVWARGMGSNNSDYGYDVAVDQAGNVNTTGFFNNTADFDPGMGTSELSSLGAKDIFVSKLDGSGNFLWAVSIGGTADDVGEGVAIDDFGNVYLTGWFQGTVDFDPGPGEHNLFSGGNRAVFVLKLDADGIFVWAKAMTSTSGAEGRAIAVDRNGNIYTTGSFYGTTDFNPDETATFELTAALEDIFISKLDSSGNFLWAGAMGGEQYENSNAIAVDNSGSVYITGEFTGTVDFDPGNGSHPLTSIGNYDVFAAKLDSIGNFLWAGAMGGPDGDHGQGIGVDKKGNASVTGYFGATADFDPGPGVLDLTSVGSKDVFVSKLDRDGNLVWAKALGGPSNDYGYDLAADGYGNIYSTGHFAGAVDFDPGEGTDILDSGTFVNIFVNKLAGPDAFPWILYYPAFTTNQ